MKETSNILLEKRNNEIYEGFMAATQELCEATEEIERLNNIIDKALEYISIKIVKTHIVWKTGERKLFLHLNEKEIRELQNILKGEDK